MLVVRLCKSRSIHLRCVGDPGGDCGGVGDDPKNFLDLVGVSKNSPAVSQSARPKSSSAGTIRMVLVLP
jgi:hypothetical protein